MRPILATLVLEVLVMGPFSLARTRRVGAARKGWVMALYGFSTKTWSAGRQA
jgi:hypothetical protein